MIKLILKEKETCPRGGETFDCGKSGKCWCYEMDVPVSVLEKIVQDYEGCLCPDCLQEISGKK